MKLLFSTIIFIVTLTGIQAQGIDFFHGTWAEALAEAEKQGKVIFVDAYAVWCGPCKKMSANVFPDQKVGEFYNKNFVNMKLDMEKGEGLTFRKKYPVSAFPTLFYIDYNGEIVLQTKGAKQVEDFIKLGKQALKKVDRSGDFAAEYEKGNRDPELVYNYVKALNQSSKSSLKVANDYLKKQDDLTTEFNLRFILEATTQADSKIFEYLEEYKSQIIALESEMVVKEKILTACQATVQKAIEYNSDELLEEAKGKMKKHYPEKASTFATQSQMEFCLTVREPKGYLTACKEYAKKEIKDDPQELFKLASMMSQNFREDEKVMKQAEVYAKEAAEKGVKYEYYLTYALILDKNGKKSDALNAANKSMELAKSVGPRATRMVETIIDRIAG